MRADGGRLLHPSYSGFEIHGGWFRRDVEQVVKSLRLQDARGVHWSDSRPRKLRGSHL
jgi:hypothetical protein